MVSRAREKCGLARFGISVAKTAVSDEEIQLRKRARRRLVGAVALVVVVVAAVPMILDSEPRQRPQHIDVQIPPIPDQPSNEPRGLQPPPRNAADSAPAPGAAARQRSEPRAADPAPVSPSGVPAKPATANGGAGEKAAVSTSAADGYAVALIATVSADKAREVKQRLERLKLPVYTQKTPDGEKTRVRVGPFASRDAAEQARQRLIKLGFDPGNVVRKGD